MSKLLGKRALVTAGAQGIGLAITRQLLAAGCDVFVHYRNRGETAKALVGEAATFGRRCSMPRLTSPKQKAAMRSWRKP